MTVQRKAIALLSGGLDSMLAVRVMQEQGIYVEGINFYTGFCVEGHTHAIRKKDQENPKRNNALWSAEQLGIKLHIEDISEEYKDIVINPKHGYGANLNPCLDCKVFMVNQALDLCVNKARQLASDSGFDFIITGEVLGQRPMSQRRDTMPVIARESGAFDRLVRPLCAKRLPATLPEREGWITREKMYGITGRSRQPQFQLAKQFGFTEWAQPAGGCCFLTHAEYSNKLQDFWNARGEKTYEIDDIMLLKVGRHIRPAPNFKLIVGREDGENNYMDGYRKQYPHVRTQCPGPLVLVDGTPTEEDLMQAARIAARFSKLKDTDEVGVEITRRDGTTLVTTVKPLRAEEMPEAWYL